MAEVPAKCVLSSHQRHFRKHQTPPTEEIRPAPAVPIRGAKEQMTAVRCLPELVKSVLRSEQILDESEKSLPEYRERLSG